MAQEQNGWQLDSLHANPSVSKPDAQQVYEVLLKMLDMKASLPVTLFPRNSAVRLVSDKLTLVLFAHPHCPCTGASLRELDSQQPGNAHQDSCIPRFIPAA